MPDYTPAQHDALIHRDWDVVTSFCPSPVTSPWRCTNSQIDQYGSVTYWNVDIDRKIFRVKVQDGAVVMSAMTLI